MKLHFAQIGFFIMNLININNNLVPLGGFLLSGCSLLTFAFIEL